MSISDAEVDVKIVQAIHFATNVCLVPSIRDHSEEFVDFIFNGLRVISIQIHFPNPLPRTNQALWTKDISCSMSTFACSK